VEIAGSDSDEIARKRLLMLANKYNRSMLEARLLFQHAYDKLYLVSQELTTRTDTVWKEDRWLLSQLLDEMKGVFAHLAQHGLASPNGPGRGRSAPTAATQLVCAPGPIQPGPNELVFVTQYSAGLKRQPLPTAKHRLCLPVAVLGLAQREGRTA